MRWLSCWHVWGPLPPPLNVDCDLHLKYGLFHHTIPVSSLHNHVCGAIICSYADSDVSLISLHRSVCLRACMCMCAGVCRGHIGSYFTQTPLCLQHTAGTALPDIPPTTCVCGYVCVFLCACMSPPLHCTHTLTPSQAYALICHDPCRISMMDKASSQIIITDSSLSLVGQQHRQNVVLAIHSGHKAWTLAHGL